MRRALASLLLVLFSFSLIAPALRADAGPDLPACCRRDGKHHCAMGSGNAAGALVFGARCPSYPGSAAYPAGANVAVVKSSAAVFAAPASYPASQRHTVAWHCIAPGRSHQKRGPPAPLV
ncbi:MAG: hypothetical protein P4L56_16495 [Candidatus Sulfopaludibacter sp.]|nr:hypothetical protein [Candidatus Sulfopaludibacter sp.]